jgi:tetratricopeptide (TPR) repeat protein
LSLHADEALDAARKRYEAGEQDYVAGRYWQAAKAFEEAYALSRRGDLLFNAARAYDRGEYAVRAIDVYQAYIDSTPEARDKDQIQSRITELRKTLAKLMISTNEQGFLFIDGHEYSRTPMQQPMDIDGGYHRIEVRKGDRVWAKEQQFSAGQSYKFDAELSSAPTGQGLADTTMVDEIRARQHTRRLAAVVGLGGAFDVAGNHFPPHQAALYLGVDYRALDRGTFAFDVALRVPMEFGQDWNNAGFLIGGRAVFSPLRKVPLDFVAELDFGLAVLDYTPGAPTIMGGGACARPSQLASCTLYGMRIHPKFAAVYRFTPAIELRGELAGVEIDVTNPFVDPRYTLDVAAAYRFF